MVSPEDFQKIALGFPEVEELPHFEKTSFRVKKKIFATLDLTNLEATVKLSFTEQDIFSLGRAEVIYPVPNKWGKQGWTRVILKKVDKALLQTVLISAYCEVAPARLSKGITRP
ncbi:MAG: MmcQ/YjbR family DNA-binding protein [Marinoscillum sp.]|uniref:MmcQ/YjbR family DNA-binding protein n=1 Tax=Marinoscillum sp. TaxID=2024838 RepID=UPI0033046D3C